MSGAMCGMTESQARLVTRWNENRMSRNECIEQREQPEHLSAAIVNSCIAGQSTRRSSRKRDGSRDNSPKSISSSRCSSQGHGQVQKDPSEAMRALQVMAQKHEEYKAQISQLKQQLSSVLGKSRTNDKSLKDDEMVKKNKDAQDLIYTLKQELGVANEKNKKAEGSAALLNEKVQAMSKKQEDYTEQITALKHQLSSARDEKEKSKEESMDMVNNFDFIAKKNEKYREQIINLKKQLSQAQDEAKQAKEATEAVWKDLASLRVESEEFDSLRTQLAEMTREQKEYKQKVFNLLGELSSANDKAKKEEEKLVKMQGKIQHLKKEQQLEQNHVEQQKETINSLNAKLESIRGDYLSELEKLRTKGKQQDSQYFRTFCLHATILGFVLVLCLPIPTWIGINLYETEEPWHLAALGSANLLVAGLISIKFKRPQEKGHTVAFSPKTIMKSKSQGSSAIRKSKSSNSA